MNIYVASSWRTPTHDAVVDALRAAGHAVYNYRDDGFHVGMENAEASYSEMQTALARAECWDKFIQDEVKLEWADTLVLVLPAGRSAHTEFGSMCGRGKRTVIIWSPSESELLHLMADQIVPDVEAVVAYLGTVNGII